MSRHVAPHRWADAWAGRVGDDERAAMDRHAASCRACARVRERVQRASDSFSSIRARQAPELPWDSVRARVHWSVSKERRAGSQPRPASRRLLPGVALGALGAGAAALALATGPIEIDPPSRAPAIAEAPAPPPSASASASASAPAPAPAPAPLVGLVNRATGDVTVDGLRPADLFARKLGPGAVIATGDGRVDIQFAEAGAFALLPGSRLELRRFDAAAIELAVEGTVDIEISPRAPQQRFAVIAGERTIEVRGTQFRVRHAGGATDVACSHGKVAVRDPQGTVEVGAARRLELAAGRAASAEQVQPLSAEEIGALADAAPLRLPVWSPEALLGSSAPLEIASAGRRGVRVDGVELGPAPLRVRVMPGRHTVETADAAGRFRRAGWVDVAPPTAGAPAARFELPAELPPARAVSERRRQLRARLDQARLRQCTRQIAKQGLTGTYVEFELRVDASGAVNFLNVVDTDLGSATATCVRNVLADVRFEPGPAATWRERVDL
jgi:hypothetical protein